MVSAPWNRNGMGDSAGGPSAGSGGGANGNFMASLP